MATHYFDQLIDYLQFGEDDQSCLRSFLPLARPHFQDIANTFYERVHMAPETRSVIRSPEQVQRLIKTLQVWMEQLLSGPWDQEYLDRRSRIGKVHVQIGLPQHHMFSAMTGVQENLFQIAWKELSGDSAQKTIIALQKITNIELAIMLESYRIHFVEKVQGYERIEKENLANQLEKSQALYHSLFDSSGVCVIVLNSNYQIQLFNPMAEELTGFSKAEAVQQNLSSLLINPLDQDKMLSLLDSVYQGQAPQPLDFRVITSDKDNKWVRWHCSLIKETSDICLLGIDITNEKKMSRQARKVETLAALGTLAAGLAHEIRNPLNAAQLQLLLVERAVTRAGDAVDKRALKSSHQVKAELKRLAGLVEDFLAYARPAELRLIPTDLSQLCSNIFLLLEGDAKAAEVQFKNQGEKDLVARIDAGRLKQVLINLLRNAIEAAGKGGHVCFNFKRIGQTIVFEIIDSGKGIPPDMNIFEPFTTSKESGTGLGLSIVHRIVTDHQGHIEVSRKNDKTHFIVEIPIDGPSALSKGSQP